MPWPLLPAALWQLILRPWPMAISLWNPASFSLLPWHVAGVPCASAPCCGQPASLPQSQRFATLVHPPALLRQVPTYIRAVIALPPSLLPGPPLRVRRQLALQWHYASPWPPPWPPSRTTVRTRLMLMIGSRTLVAGATPQTCGCRLPWMSRRRHWSARRPEALSTVPHASLARQTMPATAEAA